MTPQAALDRGLGELALELAAGRTRTSARSYMALLAKWNRTYNLTAIRDPLADGEPPPARFAGRGAASAVAASGALADVGSGAGLPGIPLAIARPRWRVTLERLEPEEGAFLRQAAIELELANVEVHEDASKLGAAAAVRRW